MTAERSLIRRVALSLSVLAVVIVAGIFYGGYDARAAAAHRSAQTGIDHARVVLGHPLTVAARASAQAIGTSVDRESVRSHLGGDANLLGILTMIDWFGLLMAGCVAIASLALRHRLQSKWPRRACRGLLLIAAGYAGVMIINSVVGGMLPTWLGDVLGWLDNVGFHAIAGLALSLVMALVLWPWRGLTNRTAVRLGRMQPDWRPLRDIFDRVGGATWETRALAVASRVITHVAVFAAVLWVPLNIWHRTLPRLAIETPSSTGVPATASFFGTAAGPTIWADFAGVLMAFIAAYAVRILILAVRESRAGRPPEPLILRHMLFLPVLAIAHRLVADLAATGLSGHLSTHPLVIYAGAMLGLMCGIWVYYQCIVLGVNVKKTVRDAHNLVIHVREWASQPRNRLRATLHGIALIFLLILMIGANSRAPFQRLVPAFNPTRIALDGPAALVSLETRVPGGADEQVVNSSAGEWRAATPGRVIDDTKASKATSLEIGVFWLAFGFGYVAEILMALAVTVVYFAACVAIVAPAMLVAAAVVAVAQALALVLDTVLLLVAMVTGWNAGFASAWLWGDVLGPAFDFIAANLGRIRLWSLLETFRGLGFQFGARLIVALPSFILVGLVLVLVYRWRARRLALPNTAEKGHGPSAAAVEVKPVLVGTSAIDCEHRAGQPGALTEMNGSTAVPAHPVNRDCPDVVIRRIV